MAGNNNEDDKIEPDAWLFNHRYVYSRDREDNRISTTELDSFEQHDIVGNIEPLYGAETITETDTEAVLWKCKGCGNFEATTNSEIKPEICGECGMKTRWEIESELLRKEVFSNE